MKKLFLFFIFAISLPALKESYSKQEPTWIFIYDDEQNSRDYMYSPESIKKDGNDLKVSIKIIPYADETANGKEIDYYINSYVFKCGESKYVISSEQIFYTDSTGSNNTPKQKSLDLKPENPLFIFYRLLCSD